MRQVVNALKLMQSQQTDKLHDRLAQAGLRSRDAIVVFLFFKVATPVLLGALAFLLVYLLQIGDLPPAGRLLAVVGGTRARLLRARALRLQPHQEAPAGARQGAAGRRSICW